MKDVLLTLSALAALSCAETPFSARSELTMMHAVTTGVDTAAFFVSPGGDDTNNGSIDHPFRTLERVRDTMRISTRKTVYLRAGVYPRTETLLLDSNDDGQTWQTYPGDPVNSAIIDGDGIQDIIDILGGSYITIDGLTVRNFTSRGIGVHGGAGWSNAAPYFNVAYGPARHNTIRNNIVENGHIPAPGWDRAGINTQGKVPDTKIQNNVVRNTTGYGIGIWSLQTGDDISGTEVRNNVLLNTCSTARDGAAIYTNDRTILSDSIFIEDNFIRDYGPFENYVRAIYLDDHTSNVSVKGNILAGSGRQPILVHGGYNNEISHNIIDLGPTGKLSVLNYAIRGTATMTGNSFTRNIIISSYLVDSAGGAFLKTGEVVDPIIEHNLYYNYSGGLANTGGYHYQLKDAFPLQGDPELAGWTYTLSDSSMAFAPPVNFEQIAGNWGPPGFEIPETGMVPSCLLPGSDDRYLHAESYADMQGIVKYGMHIRSCDHGDWVKFENVKLDTGHSRFSVRFGVTDANAGRQIEVRLGSPTGTLMGSLTTTGTGAYDAMEEQQTTISAVSGTFDVYFVFSGGSGVGNIDYFKLH